MGSVTALVLGAFAAGAGAIHFAMVPSHADEWLAAGIFFAVIGAVQVAFAAALAFRPSRDVVLAGCLFSLGVLGVWAVARTSGLPFWPSAGETEPVTRVDAVTAAFEGAFLVVSAAALRWRPSVPRLAGLVPALGVVVVTTAVLVSPSAGNHAGYGEGAAAGHPEGTSAAAATGDGHGHAVAEGESASGSGSGSSAQEAALPGLASAAGGGSGHGDGTVVPDKPLAPEDRVTLADQLVTARATALRYPTVADAERDGYVMVTPYVPLIGAHYMKFSIVDNRFEIEAPEMLLYDGSAPDSKMVGLSYYQLAVDAPSGFAGPNDHWHQHIGLCLALRDGQPRVIGGERTTVAQCRAMGGFKSSGAGGWMVHAWVVPSWESPQGVFSAENPNLV